MCTTEVWAFEIEYQQSPTMCGSQFLERLRFLVQGGDDP